MKKNSILFIFLQISLFSSYVSAKTDLMLSGVHLCCSTCQKTVETVVEAIKGNQVKVNRTNNTVKILAPNKDSAQRSLNAMASAGFYGNSSSEQITMNYSFDHETVSKTSLVGNHNCCLSCASALKSSLLNVEGVETVTVKKRSCKIKGQFDIADALTAGNKAGFSLKRKP